MSAFVVDMDAMDRVVRTICARIRFDRPVVGRFAGLDTENVGNRDEIGRRLFTLNIEAVMQRYPDCQDRPENLPGEEGCAAYPRTYHFRGSDAPPTHAELVAGYKAIQRLDYQCSEGDIPGRSKLYRELVEVRAAVADVIIERLPEYEAVPWA